jgi:putative component of toxin-antitoxin plasmid stabilization module
MDEAIKFIKDYCDFSNPDEVWMLKGVSRSKDNQEGFHRFMRRLVMVTPEDIESCYEDIRGMGNQSGTSYRIYVSLNSRNVIKGMFQFQKKLLDISHGVARGLEDMKKQTTKLASVWKTELEQKGCRGTKRVLIDVDNGDKAFLDMVLYNVRQLDTTIHFVRPTVSGYAVVIEACDMRPFYAQFGTPENNKYVDVQRDSMVFVEKWDGKE